MTTHFLFGIMLGSGDLGYLQAAVDVGIELLRG
jgi:hypothetical protein